MRQSPGSCFSSIFLAVSASARLFPRFSIASGRAQRARGSRAGPTQRPHNVPQKAIHNVYTTSYTTSTQRLHNVRTTFQGLIPKENEDFEDQGRMPESRELLFLHIFSFLLRLAAKSWFWEAGSELFAETVSYKLVLRSRISACC